jgi:D-alanyl-D-alanine carboxypeptidase
MTVTLGDCMNHETGIPDLIEEDPFYLGVLNKPNKAWEAEDLLGLYTINRPCSSPAIRLFIPTPIPFWWPW